MTNLLVRTFLLVVGLVGATVSATPTKECAYTNYRLPKHIVPKHYNLDISIDTQKYEYKGDVTINLRVDKNEDKQVLNNIIVLNVHPDVGVSDVTYVDMGSGMLSDEDFSLGYNNVDEICRDIENELLVINLGENLAHQAEGELIISFHGKVREDSTGIYKSQYKSQAGVDSYYVSTDFQPNKARRAFPCFDEPSFKATFNIQITHDSAKVALANTRILSEKIEGDQKVSKFKATPLMSIHLIAFAIGEFEYIEKAPDRGGPTIRAYTPVGKSHQAQFALDTAVNAFTELEEYYGVPLPLEKIDMLTGVGHNYGVRGNWGLIVCKETLFLFDDENSSPIYKGYSAQIVVHGLSQQWFGNLVTLKWWNDIWLQEGFNTWMAYNLTDYLYPKLQWGQNYLIDTHQKALYLDSRENTHPIRIAAVGKSNIDGILDQLVHLKSTAIIKFLHDVYLKSDKFRDGTKLYMEDYRYGNAEASDLWNKLHLVSGLSVDRFIRSWTEQPGHPLVMVHAESGGKKRLIFEQRRFGPASATADSEVIPQCWIIPLEIVLSDGKHHRDTQKINFYKRKQTMDLPYWFDFRKDGHWVKVNEDFRGFYHVQYSVNLLEGLRNPVSLKALSTSNRIGLLDDFKALHRSDLLSKRVQLKHLLQWYLKGTEGVVLGQFARALSLLDFHPKNLVHHERDLLRSTYDLNPLSSEQLLNAGTREGMGVMDSSGLLAIYSIMLEWNHRPLVKEARALFDTAGNEVAPIIRGLVYKAVAKYGTVKQISKLQSFASVPTNCIEDKLRLDVAFAILSDRQKPLESSLNDTRDPRGKRKRSG